MYSLPAMTTWISAGNTTNNSITITPVISGQDYFVKLYVYTASGLWGVTKEQKVGRSTKAFAMNESSENTNDLNLYPNPFVEQINLEISTEESSTCNWSIYDMNGKQVISGNQDLMEGNNTLNIDASTLAKGVYMLNAIINNEKHSFRILKQ